MKTIFAAVPLLASLACSGSSADPAGAGAAPGGTGGSNGVGGGSGSGGDGLGGGSGSAGGVTSPETTITAAPTGTLGAQTPASFAFECGGGACTFECGWDEGPWEACTSPATRAGWADGAHAFRVRAVRGGLSDESPATASFDVDAVLPTLTMMAQPGAQPNSRLSSFSFACSETACSYECSLDDASYAPCDAQTSLDALAPGQHTLSARSIDAAGNVSLASVTHSWTLGFGWRSLAVATRTACAVSGERKLYCWGSDTSGLLGNGGVPSETVGATTTPTQVGTASNWDSVLAGADVLCAQTTSNENHCWGRNEANLFGDSALTPDALYAEPTQVATSYPTLAFGDGHACAIDAAGRLSCWGDGEYGRLGDGNVDEHDTLTPTLIGADTWRSVATGSGHTCAIQSNGALFCFGGNEYGECGQPSSTEAVATPTAVGSDTDWTDVAVGSSFSCGRKANGTLYCWGANPLGQLGNGTRTSSEVPTQVGTDSDWRNVTAHSGGACAVKTDGTAWCWGSNELGEIGSRHPGGDSTSPVQLESNEQFSRVFGASQLRCVRTEASDQIQCWGDNVNSGGGLGRGIKGGEAEALGLDTGYSALSITSNPYGGAAHGGCGIKTDGKLYCWGVGKHVGIAGAQIVLEPAAISDATGWSAIDLSSESSPASGNGSYGDVMGHACGIRSGDLYCWGANDFGQLGLGDTLAHGLPTQVTAIATTWRRVSVGSFATCALTTSGTLYCWGRNQLGELGQGDALQRSVPTQVGTETDWDSVAFYGARVVGHRTNGTLWLWGSIANNVPTQADSGGGLTPTSDWVDGRASSNSWCGLKSDGTMQCRILSQPLATLVGITDVERLFKSDMYTCGQRVTGQLFCMLFDGTNWVEQASPYPTPPSGTDWVTHQFGNGLSCGIKTSGQRFCSGSRRLGSLGDGFDERVPGFVSLPE